MSYNIKDIARICGVSVSTVSKILNNKADNISEATKKMILKRVKELNYIPNETARSMVTKKSRIIAFVIPDISNPYFPEIARGIGDLLIEKGFHLLIYNTGGNLQVENQIIDYIKQFNVQGVIFSTQNCFEENEKIGELYETSNISVVLIERNIKKYPNLPGIYVDNEKGSYDATKFLISKGHKKIAVVTGPLSIANIKYRFYGFQKAMEEAGLMIDHKLIIESDFTTYGGEKAVNHLLESYSDNKFTALFAFNDLMAWGAVTAIKKKAIIIPDDIAVIGFDGILISEAMNPALSTVSTPMYLIGNSASNKILEQIESKNNLLNQAFIQNKLIIPPRLIIRDST